MKLPIPVVRRSGGGRLRLVHDLHQASRGKF